MRGTVPCTCWSRNQWSLKSILSDREKNTQRQQVSPCFTYKDIILGSFQTVHLENVALHAERIHFPVPAAAPNGLFWNGKKSTSRVEGRVAGPLTAIYIWSSCCPLSPHLVKFAVQHLSPFLMSCLPCNRIWPGAERTNVCEATTGTELVRRQSVMKTKGNSGILAVQHCCVVFSSIYSLFSSMLLLLLMPVCDFWWLQRSIISRKRLINQCQASLF